MNITLSKPTIYGLALLITMVSGVMLSNAGKPLNTAIFSIHKLIAVGTVIVMAVSIRQLHQTGGLHALQLGIFAITGVFFLTLIVSGALLSVVDADILTLNQTAFQTILRIHQTVPLLALAASALSLYMLVGSRA